MLRAILVLGFRADVGAYVIDYYPHDFDPELVDAMNVYNLHRFRTTERNFKIIQTAGQNLASYYSGFKNTNYIGQPDHCITLVLDKGDNPAEYEKVLIKVTNNLLTTLGTDEFDEVIQETFELLREKNFDEIKVIRGASIPSEEESTKKEVIPTISSASLSDEEKIFAELMESEELSQTDSAFDSKMADFEKSLSGDPFSGGSSVSDPFGGGAAQAGSRDIFAENPFDAAQKPSFEAAFGVDETVGKTLFQKKKTTAAEIVAKLDSLEKSKPKKPDTDDKEALFKYLEALVGFLEEKVKILGTLANEVKELQKADEEKDQLIGKLLLMLKK
ncbi:MAG: hypothetical protein ACTSQS_11675 [Promethearchaeota archaeon]